jgi:hypothetical protein
LGLAAVVVGLGLSVVDKVKHTACRTACQNNFKQLLIAAETYHDVYRTFPPGTMPNPDLPVERRISWYVPLVPFMESTDLARRYDKTVAWDDAKNALFHDYAMKPLRCPSFDRKPTDAMATYAGVAGVGADSPTLPVDHPRAGIFGYDRGTPRAAIKDGEANTILLMEYGRGPVPWAKGGEGTVAWFAEPPHVGPGRPFGTPHLISDSVFARSVSCGIVGFADASVRVIRVSVSPGVLEGLATIAGGESVAIPE